MPSLQLNTAMAGPVATVIAALPPTRLGSDTEAAPDLFARALSKASTPPPAAPQHSNNDGRAAERNGDAGSSEAAAARRAYARGKSETRAMGKPAVPAARMSESTPPPPTARDAAAKAGPAADADRADDDPASADPSADEADATASSDAASLIADWLARGVDANEARPKSSRSAASALQALAASSQSSRGPGTSATDAAADTASARPGSGKAVTLDATAPADLVAQRAPEGMTLSTLASALPAPLAGAAPGAGPLGTAPATAEGRLRASPGSAEFAPQLGAQLSVFVREGVQHARLQLHPAELGPLTVQIQLEGATAQVHLAAEHPLTRQALEQAMPTLASALRDAGLTLTGGGVFEQPRQPQDQREAAADPGRARAPGGADATATAVLALPATTVRRGVVDLIA